MSLSIGNLMSNYTYNYGSNLRPNLDANRDGSWSKQEVSNYSTAYETVTGKAIDVDNIFKTYDADESGALSYSEYENAIADDALGVEYLSSQSQQSAEAESASESSKVADWLSTLTDLQKASITKSTFWAETTSNLINSMFGSNESLSGFAYALNQYNTVKAFGSANYMKSMMPTFDFTV